MLYGIGAVSIGTNALDANSLLGQNLVLDNCVAGVAFNSESASVSAMCYKNGIKQKVAERINQEMYSVTLTYEYLDWPTMQLIYGELAQNGAAYVPTAQTVTLTGTTITNTNISTTNNNVASVRVFNATTETFMTLAAGAPAAQEYSVNGTTGLITFNAAQTGQTIYYRYDRRYTSIESIGAGNVGQQFDEFNNLNLTAILSSSKYPEGIALVADQLERTSTPSLVIEGDKAVIQITYSLVTPPGRRKPFTLYKLNGAV